MARLGIDPGRLRTALTLEQPIAAPDGYGGEIESWSAVATVFGLVEPLGAASAVAAGRPQVTVTHRVTIRYLGEVASGMRLLRGARSFLILSAIDPDETGRFMVCEAQEAGR